MIIDITIVGAGVIGLALAQHLATEKKQLLILEKNRQFGEEISSRSSEVIHAGIYYPKHSLKAKLCVKGNNALYQYCQQYQVPYRRTGKLIIAQDVHEQARLENIKQQALANGVSLEYYSKSMLAKNNPELQGELALWSASTGIIDSHALMLSFLGKAKSQGEVNYVANTKVVKVIPEKNHLLLYVNEETEPVKTRYLINAAGLGAQQLAHCINGLSNQHIPKLYPCKGQYYRYHAKSPFNTLIYPLPTAAGLGIHATIDLANQIRFGPDTHYTDALDYSLPNKPDQAFISSIRRYFPTINPQYLQADYVGIRPKLQGPEMGFMDFQIQTSIEHNIPGLIQCFGIESPGLTASLALADYISQYVE